MQIRKGITSTAQGSPAAMIGGELRPEDYHGCAGLVMGFALGLICAAICAVIYFLVFG